MTRMASKAQLDYFRTQDPEVRAIADLLRLPMQSNGVIRVLDPCVGEARALQLLLEDMQLRIGVSHPLVEAFGIEVHNHRAQQAAKALGAARVLRTSYLRAYITARAFQLVFLNPPYDFDTAVTVGGKKERLENTFLWQATHHLAPGGVLVWIVPQQRVAEQAEYLASHYDHLRCWRFSDEEWGPPEQPGRKASPIYSQFRQVVLFGICRPEPVTPSEALVIQIRSWTEAGELLPILPRPGTAAPEDRYLIPVGRYQSVQFLPRAFDATAAAARVTAGGGAWGESWYADEHWPAPEEAQVGLANARPLVPLRQDMMIWLLVAGLFNGFVITGPDGHPLLLKGVSHKEVVSDSTVLAADDGSREEIHTFTDTFISEVWIRDLVTGDLIRVK